MRYNLEIDENGKIDIPKELWRTLLNYARRTQKGRRGLSSKKIRVQKKIVKEEILTALELYIKE